MPRYELLVLPSAMRALAALDSATRRRVAARIDTLCEERRPSGCRKLAGSQYWRIRVGDYRVVYSIEGTKLTVLVVRIGHRREVYR